MVAATSKKKRIRINKTRSQIIYTYCKCIIPTNEKKTEHEKMLLKIQYRETEQWNEFSENHQRAEVLNRTKTVAGVGFFPLHLMHFYIQLATVNKFTYCVIWYFNIILSPLFLSVLFSLSLLLLLVLFVKIIRLMVSHSFAGLWLACATIT